MREELQQHLVRRQRHVAEAGAEEEKLVKLACSTTERIRMSPLTCAIRRSRAGSKTRAQSRHCAAGEGRAAEPEAEGEPGPFGDQRRRRDARHAPAEAEHEEEVEQRR